MSTQLEIGTYCRFDNAEECEKAFEKATKELLIPTVYPYDKGNTYLIYHNNLIRDTSEYIMTCNEGNVCLLMSEEIPKNEFLARMENNWKVPQR